MARDLTDTVAGPDRFIELAGGFRDARATAAAACLGPMSSRVRGFPVIVAAADVDLAD